MESENGSHFSSQHLTPASAEATRGGKFCWTHPLHLQNLAFFKILLPMIRV
jgi:hypothetical protein